MAKLKTEMCPHCGGTGKVPANDSGGTLRTERERVGVSGRKLAVAMGISFTHLYDMENGRRGVSAKSAANYLKKLTELSNGE